MFPNLKTLAEVVLVIPDSSVAAERRFILNYAQAGLQFSTVLVY